MDKRSKQRRQKSPSRDELNDGESAPPRDVAPRGASFDTEEGRAAQGMRPDIGVPDADSARSQDDDAAKLTPEANDDDDDRDDDDSDANDEDDSDADEADPS